MNDQGKKSTLLLQAWYKGQRLDKVQFDVNDSMSAFNELEIDMQF